jgi:hypothetical protein
VSLGFHPPKTSLENATDCTDTSGEALRERGSAMKLDWCTDGSKLRKPHGATEVKIKVICERYEGFFHDSGDPIVDIA